MESLLLQIFVEHKFGLLFPLFIVFMISLILLYIKSVMNNLVQYLRCKNSVDFGERTKIIYPLVAELVEGTIQSIGFRQIKLKCQKNGLDGIIFIPTIYFLKKPFIVLN